MADDPDDAPADDDATTPDSTPGAAEVAEASGALDALEETTLGERPSLTRSQVAEQAGVDVEAATRLWQLMGFASTDDDAVAFTAADVEALRHAQELTDLGILSADRQAALVRTWGRSFARLADWQTSLLATVAAETGATPSETLSTLAQEVLPRVESLQNYVWRRHLAGAGARLLMVPDPTASATPTAVVFVDIVGYTSRSKNLSEDELVDWLEGFESEVLDLAVSRGARIIKNIGDEVLFVADDAVVAVDLALELVERGEDESDDFPEVRAGVAYGEVVSRLGDVFGATVNIAARLTSVARPGTVLIDRGAHGALTGQIDAGQSGEQSEDHSGNGEHHDRHDGYHPPNSAYDHYTFRRLRRLSVKGYARLAAWSVRGS